MALTIIGLWSLGIALLIGVAFKRAGIIFRKPRRAVPVDREQVKSLGQE